MLKKKLSNVVPNVCAWTYDASMTLNETGISVGFYTDKNTPAHASAWLGEKDDEVVAEVNIDNLAKVNANLYINFNGLRSRVEVCADGTLKLV